MNTWIVVANAGGAKLFSQQHRGDKPALVEEMLHPEGRLHETDIMTDELVGERSTSKTRHGAGMPRVESTYQPHQTPRQHENELFARQVAERLRRAHLEGSFQELVLAASPEFLALLRKVTDAQVLAAARLEINKDYTKLNPQELLDQLEILRAKN